jgi:hypothetical protein
VETADKADYYGASKTLFPRDDAQPTWSKHSTNKTILPVMQQPHTPFQQSNTSHTVTHHTCHHHVPAALSVHLHPSTALSVIDAITGGTIEHAQLIKCLHKDEWLYVTST